jgi:hypothetical protein
VQVFNPAGELVKSIRTRAPVKVRVHHRSGEIFVFSWKINTIHKKSDRGGKDLQPTLTRFGPLEDPGKPTVYEIPVSDQRRGLQAELDTWADPITVWLDQGIMPYQNDPTYWQADGLKLLQLRDGKLVPARDLGAQAARDVVVTRRVSGTGRNLAVNPAAGTLYVGDGSAMMGLSWSAALEIDPDTGKKTLVRLPFDCEQMTFDGDGLAYLRARNKIVRYDPSDKWREIPWDYGEQHPSVGTTATKAKGPGMCRDKVASALVLPGWEHSPQGVFGVSPTGRIVVPIKGKHAANSGLVFRKGEEPVVHQKTPYQFKIYPGRTTRGLVPVFDRHGKLITDDAIPGVGFTHGVKIDRDNNLYAMVLGNRVIDGKHYWNPAAGTLVKWAAGQARVVGTHNKAIPVPLAKADLPDRAPDWLGGGKTGLKQAWAPNARWFYGGVGYNGEHHKNPDYGCDCNYSSFDLDYFARSFVPEVDHYSVAVLDSAGNLILRIGDYGNVDDGKPLIPASGPPNTRSIGGDEVALFHAMHLAVHSDRRLFIADLGNERIVSVKLGYHTSERVKLDSGG